MDIKHQENNGKGKFTFSKDNKEIAEVIFSMKDQQLMLIEHVEVKPALRGQGIGNAAVKAAADYARENDIKIRPLCYFAKVTMRSESYKDVLQG